MLHEARDAVVASGSFVVGTAPRDKLAELAVLDAVRKIEPTELQPE